MASFIFEKVGFMFDVKLLAHDQLTKHACNSFSVGFLVSKT